MGRVGSHGLNGLESRTVSQDVSKVTGKSQDIARAALDLVKGDQHEACSLLTGLSLTLIEGSCELVKLEVGCEAWLHGEGLISNLGSLDSDCTLLRFPRHYSYEVQLFSLETLEVMLLSSLLPESSWICRKDLQVPEIRAQYGRGESVNLTLHSKIFRPGLVLVPLEQTELCILKTIKKPSCSQAPGKSLRSPQSPPSVLALDRPELEAASPSGQNYQLIRHIGRGAFGSVHLASSKNGAFVAVKCVPVDGQEMQEARLLRLAKHPHIVSILDCFLWEKQLCIVMEYLPENLHKRIGGKPLPVHEVRSFMRQLLLLAETCSPRHVEHILGVAKLS